VTALVLLVVLVSVAFLLLVRAEYRWQQNRRREERVAGSRDRHPSHVRILPQAPPYDQDADR